MGLLVNSKKPKNCRVRLKIEDKNLFIKEKTMSIVENKSSFRAACIQLNSYRNAEENIENIVKFFNVAVKNDSDFVTLPEVAGMLEPNTTLLEQKVVYEKEDIILSGNNIVLEIFRKNCKNFKILFKLNDGKKIKKKKKFF